MSRRKTTDDERTLFRETIDEARPLAPLAPAVALPATSASRVPGVSGLDGRTDEKLRRGALEPEARLDLHGFTERDAHHALLSFLRTAQLRGHKLVLVVTGKGARVAPDAPFDLELNYRSRGILKAVVPRWLGEPAFAGVVAGTRLAHRKHGGEGALYIYLRKTPMKQKFHTLHAASRGPGLTAITAKVESFVRGAGIGDGLLTLFIRHTSASLLIQENADPDVLRDLEDFMVRMVSRDPALYRHTTEGPDDMPSHIRSALTATSLSIPVQQGAMVLGTWQGIYLFEHRDGAHDREIVLHVIGD